MSEQSNGTATTVYDSFSLKSMSSASPPPLLPPEKLASSPVCVCLCVLRTFIQTTERKLTSIKYETGKNAYGIASASGPTPTCVCVCVHVCEKILQKYVTLLIVRNLLVLQRISCGH